MSKERFSRGKSMDDTDVPSGRQDRVRPSDLFDIYPIPEKWGKTRFFGPIFKTGGHWVKTKTKDGKMTSFYAPCTAFDADEGKRDSTKKCPWCAHKGDKEEVRFASDFWSNAIIRALQKSKPASVPKPTKAELSTGFKDKDSESWTPVRAVRLTGNTLKGLKDLKQLNVTEGEDGETVGYAVSHPKYGCDVMLKQDSTTKTPANRYQIQKGEMKALTKEEKEYLIWDLSELPEAPSYEEAKSEYDKWYERMHGGKKPKADADDDEDDEDDTPRKKKGKVVDDEDEDDLPPKSKKKSSKSRDDDEDDDEDDLPPKSKKKASKSDDDEDDDDFDEDEDDEDEPPKKKGKAPAKKPAKKSSRDDDDDEDEDDDDDEDDEPPRKSSKKPAKKSSRDDDEEDDDDEDDDEPPKKSSKAKSKVVDEDEDEDDEDDEDDEPPRKKSAKKPAAKKRSRDDDDDDDDL